MDNTRTEEIQAELRKIYEDLQRQIERATEIGRELAEAEPSKGPLGPMKPARFLAERLLELGEGTTLPEYLSQLHRLATMSVEEMRDECSRYQWQELLSVSNFASRGLNEIGEMLCRACGDENPVGLASLFRGVRLASEDYVVLAERLEAHARTRMGVQAMPS